MKDDEFDALIGGALGEYSQPEPLGGLEERVLNRVRAEGEVRRRPWWMRWGWVVPVVACAVLALVFLRPVPRVAPPQIVAVTPAPPKPVLREAAPAPRPVTQRKQVRRVPRPALPKLEQFPAPAPLTEEERALLALAKQGEPAHAAFLDLEKRKEPITVQALKIEPLHIEEIR